jgi:hypothetical protein
MISRGSMAADQLGGPSTIRRGSRPADQLGGIPSAMTPAITAAALNGEPPPTDGAIIPRTAAGIAAGAMPQGPIPTIMAAAIKAGQTGSPAPVVSPTDASPTAALNDEPPSRNLTPQQLALISDPRSQRAAGAMDWGEARGEPAIGRQASLDVAVTRALQENRPLWQVIGDPKEGFAGYNARSRAVPMTDPTMRSIMGDISPILSGQLGDVTGGATKFYNPALQARLGRPPPNWDDGTGRQFGSQLFFGGQPQPPPAQTASATAPRPPGPAPGGPAGGPAPTGLLPAAASGGPRPGGIPMQPGITPQESWQAKQYEDLYHQTGNPMYLDEASKIYDTAAMRARTPVELNKGQWWDPQGGAHSAEQYRIAGDLGGGNLLVVNTMTNEPKIVNTGQYGGAAGEGRRWETQGGQSVSVPITLGAAGGGAPPGAAGPGSSAQAPGPSAQAPGQGSSAQPKFPAPIYGPMGQNTYQGAMAFYKADPRVDAALKISNLANAARAFLADPNPITAAGVKDLYTRAATNTVARVQMIHLQEEGYSPFDKFKNMVSTWKGQGNLDAQLRTDYGRAFDALDAATREQAQSYLESEKPRWMMYQGNTEKQLDDLLPPDTSAKSAPAKHGSVRPPGAPQDARQAPDGEWYSPDPNRPGKYLKW